MQVKAKYVLLLNSDAFLNDKVEWKKIFKFMNENPDVGVLTLKVVLPDGSIDPASHRGFPTIWRAFSYFSGLERIFGKIPLLGIIFGGYHLTHINLREIHEIDSPMGAFYLARRDLLLRVKGFDDKNFFLYGEDLDLSYRIKKLGYKIIYYPFYKVTHLKRASGIKKKDEKIKDKSKELFYDAMKIFYRKHYENRYPKLLNKFIYFSIDLKKKLS